MQLLHHGYLQLPAQRSLSLQRLNSYFSIYKGASPVDRSGTITFPTRMKSVFPLPKMRDFRDSYADICERRAIELLRLADVLATNIYVFWSGGVDSTCALVSLLKHCKDRSRITVLMNEASVHEYPLFYSQHIRHKLACRSADLFTDLIAGPNIFINGEHNDQLFGSDIMADAISLFGFETIVGRLQREVFTSLFQHLLNGDRKTALFFSGLFGRFVETASVPLRTNFDLLWWINYTVKWQTVYMRPLIFSKNALSFEHVKTYYHPFFVAMDFQLWSMNNTDKRIKDHWRTYKWPAKQVIYEFTRDADYRDHKVKLGSLRSLLLKNKYHNFIDEDFAFRETMDWYEPQNDLART